MQTKSINVLSQQTGNWELQHSQVRPRFVMDSGVTPGATWSHHTHEKTGRGGSVTSAGLGLSWAGCLCSRWSQRSGTDNYCMTVVARHLAPDLRAGDTWWEWDILGRRVRIPSEVPWGQAAPECFVPSTCRSLPVHSGKLPGLASVPKNSGQCLLQEKHYSVTLDPLAQVSWKPLDLCRPQ